jgi:hypothetical protein
MNKSLINEIGILKQSENRHFVTDGSWSLHELLEYVLKQTGSAHVQISSFALSEVAIRSFAQLIDEQKIITLNCLFDKSCRRTKFDLLTYCASISNIRLSENHMKLILIKNNNWSVAINSSANFTPNKRTEAGVITSITSDYNYYADCFQEIFSKAVVYEYDI